MLKTRSLPLTAFAIGASALLFPVIAVSQSTSTLAGTMLTGAVRDANGKPMEGVVVSARDVEKTFTTSVFTDEHGNYFFPVLDKARYRVWVQAVGYEAGRAELSLDPAKNSRQDFTMKTVQDFAIQLSSAEWVAALPGETREDLRLRELFQHTCANCHTPGYVLQNRFDKAGWLAIITAMESIGGGAGGWVKSNPTLHGAQGEAPWPDVQHFKEELATYLARMRGPGPSPMKFRPLPRPTGEAARVVMTEYDVPPLEAPDRLSYDNGSNWFDGTPSAFENRGTHDVTEDFSGNAWIGANGASHYRSYAKIDAKTGKVTNYKVDAPDGWARSSFETMTGPDGAIWISIRGGLGKIDPATGKIEIFAPPKDITPLPTGGVHIDVDGKGKVWMVTNKGGLRFDPVTSKFRDFISLNAKDPRFETYGLAADAEGDGWWAEITLDKLGASDIENNKIRDVQLAPRSELKELATAEDLNWYNRPNSLEHFALTSPLWAQTPRRLAGDHSGSTMWCTNLFGQDIAEVDIHTLKVNYYDLPIPYATAYDLHVDDKHVVWVSLRNADRVGKFDPATKKWTVYKLPSLGGENRGIYADEYHKTGNVWVASFRGSKATRLQFRTEQEMAAVQAKMNASKGQ